MKLLKKLTGLILAVVLPLGLFSGCKGLTSGKDLADDMVYQATGLSRDTVVMKVDGTPITAEVYCYWLMNSIDYLNQQSYNSEGINWADTQEEQTVAQYVTDDAVETVKLHQVVENHANQEGVKLTEEDQAYLKQLREYFIQNIGGDEAAYLKELKLIGLTDDTFMHLNQVSLLYTKLYEKLYGEGAEGYPSTEELQKYADQYAKDQGYTDFKDYVAKTGYLFAKHILLKTTDDSGNALSAEKKAEKKAAADSLLAQLRASQDPLTLFDKLMHEHSEDTGLSTNPDGYIFGSGEMDETFEKTVQSLGDNEISDVVEISYGYDIILRRPALDMMAQNYGYEKLNEQVKEWQSAAKVEYTGAFKQINPQTYYEKMKEIYAAAQPAASPSPSAAVPESPAASQGAASPSPSPAASAGASPSAAPAA